jgi:hypothetical protein
VRSAAADTLTTLLTDQAMLEKLIDRGLVTGIAKQDTGADVRQAAVGKLTDQALLADFAKNDTDPSVREAAVGRLEDESLLAAIAELTQPHDAGGRARERLKDLPRVGDVGTATRALENSHSVAFAITVAFETVFMRGKHWQPEPEVRQKLVEVVTRWCASVFPGALVQSQDHHDATAALLIRVSSIYAPLSASYHVVEARATKVESSTQFSGARVVTILTFELGGHPVWRAGYRGEVWPPDSLGRKYGPSERAGDL